MQIDIAHIARLSRLAIEEDKLPKFQSQMEHKKNNTDFTPRFNTRRIDDGYIKGKIGADQKSCQYIS